MEDSDRYVFYIARYKDMTFDTVALLPGEVDDFLSHYPVTDLRPVPGGLALRADRDQLFKKK